MSPNDPVHGDLATRAALAEATAAVRSLAEADLWRLGDPELLGLLASVGVLAGRVHAVRLRLTAEVDDRGSAQAAGATSTVSWLRGATRVRLATAIGQVRLARALQDRYSDTAAALASGALSPAHAEVIRDCLDRLPAAVSTATRVEAETQLVDWAAIHDPAALTRLGRHLHTVLDPDGPEEVARAEQAGVHARELHLTELGDGGLRLRGWLDAESGAGLLAVLDPLAGPRPSAVDGPDLRSAARRRADALLDLVDLAMAHPQAPTSGGAAPTLVLTLSYAELTAAVTGATLTTGAQLSPASIRRLACDAGVVPAVLAGASQPLDIGRRTRVVPAAIRRALELRDGGCIADGCERPPAHCHAHHVHHWADGGPTCLSNLALLCGHHHRVIHNAEGWSVRLDVATGRPRLHPPPWTLVLAA